MNISRRLFSLSLLVALALFAMGANAAHRALRLDGDKPAAEFGYSTAAGDFNGDGYNDLAVGVPSYGSIGGTGHSNGRVYVYYGAPSGLQAVPDWIADSNQPTADTYFGTAVANAGDVNQDGIDDLIIGEPDNAGGGQVFLFLGSGAGLASSSTTPLSAEWGISGSRPLAVPSDAAATLSIGQAGDKFGAALAAIGDVNKDGYADIIVGAYDYSNGQSGEGAAFIYYGSGTGLQATPQQTLEIDQAGARFGKSVASAGDINNDTWPDLIIGADMYDTSQTDAGAAFVYYGTPSGIYASTPDWSMEGDQDGSVNGTNLGASVASAGDVNNDGYDDVIIGAWAYDDIANGLVNAGAAFVFYGSAGGLAGAGSAPVLATPADADWYVYGENSTDAFGTSVAGVGDVNGDGYADVIVGADSYDYNVGQTVPGGFEGRAYLFYGSAIGFSSTTADWSFSPSGDGAIGAHYGAWVRPAGDIDGDGRDDYAVSAYGYPVSGDISNPEGSVFIYLSRPAPAVVASPAGGLTTTEAGGTATFTLALNVDPSADVTVHVATDDATEGTVSTGTLANNLTFTGGPGGNWAVPRTVTITGKDDSVDDGDVPYNITFTVSSSDTNYNGLSVAPVTVTNSDDDTVGVTVTPASGVVTEFGATATFTIVLDSQPTADVTIPISSSDTNQGTVLPASVTFTSLNWNVPKTVTVTGTNSSPANNAYTIILGTAAGGDYNGIDPTDVPAVNRYSTVTVAATDASASEPGTDTGTFTVSRDGNTSYDLVVNYTVSSASTAISGVDYTALSGSVTIATGQSSATVMVTPINDNIIEPDETVVIGIAPNPGAYVADSASAAVTIVDDDTPPTASFSADQVVAEGSTVTVSVSLSHAAISYPVVIPYTVSGTAVNPDDHNAADGTLTINSGTTGSLTFTTVSDNISESDETVIFTMGTPSNATAGTQSTTIITITEGNGAAPSGGGGSGAMGIWLWLAMLVRNCLRRRSRIVSLLRSFAVLAMVGLELSACGGGGSSGNNVPLPGAPGSSGGSALYAIRGFVTGLAGALVLQNNGGDNLTLTSNGGFTFGTSLSNGAAYTVSVFANPSDQTCAVSNGSGTVQNSNVTNVSVTCTTNPSAQQTSTVSGSLTGLSGGSVLLQLNGGDDKTLSADGAFTFTTTNIGADGNYQVTVKTQPAGQTCAVTNGMGQLSGSSASGVTVTCSLTLGFGARTASKIAAGRNHTCVILDTGAVKCWGANASGQLGLGDTVDRGRDPNDMGDNLPSVDLGTGRTAVQIATGNDHSCAVLDDGSVKCWGLNASGQLGQSDMSNNLGDAAGEMGDSLPTVDLGTGHTAVRITAGWRHSCAILDDGSVKCWGNNLFGQLGGGNVNLGSGRTAVEISAGDAHTCALLNDASVKCWGDNSYGQLGQGDALAHSGAVALDLGSGRTVLQVAAGTIYGCALLDNYEVKCWGGNNFGQLGVGDTANRGDDAGEMGDNLPAVDLGSSRTATQIAAGHEHTCAILDNATVKCWGYNIFGELGLGDSAYRGDGAGEMGDSLSAVDLGSGHTALQIVVGKSDYILDSTVGTHSCAILDDNTLKCWGSNAFGQLGFIDAFNDTAIGNNPGEMGDNLPPVNLGN